jgi:oxygen-independent coproporphyrinogen III oxidase
MNTTTAQAPPPAAPAGAATTVGNYFVSNYPPFSFWKTDRLEDVHAVLRRPPAPGTALGLYCHIPFCRKRCHFCYFKVYTDKDSVAIKAYLDLAIRELEFYAGQPFIGDAGPSLSISAAARRPTSPRTSSGI